VEAVLFFSSLEQRIQGRSSFCSAEQPVHARRTILYRQSRETRLNPAFYHPPIYSAACIPVKNKLIRFQQKDSL